jgi:hypothetical protein
MVRMPRGHEQATGEEEKRDEHIIFCVVAHILLHPHSSLRGLYMPREDRKGEKHGVQRCCIYHLRLHDEREAQSGR